MRKSAHLRKAEMVSTVLKLADHTGPDRVTTAAVAAAVGVTQAALFRHFPTKAAMWQAVAEHIVKQVTSAWETALSTNSSPLARLTAVVSAQLEQIASTPALPMLLFSRELNVENAELRKAFRTMLVAYQCLLIDEIAAGQQAGLLRTNVAATDAALLLTSLVQGVAIRWSLGARDFCLQDEGLRILKVQLRLLTEEGSCS